MKLVEVKVEKLNKISRIKAKQLYQNGYVVYVSLTKDVLCFICKKQDGEEFPISAYGKQYYEESRVVIVTRHRHLVEYLREHGIEGKTLGYCTEADLLGKDVFGRVPVHLMSACRSVAVVHFERSVEQILDNVTYEEFKNLIKCIRKYNVNSVEIDKEASKWNI